MSRRDYAREVQLPLQFAAIAAGESGYVTGPLAKAIRETNCKADPLAAFIVMIRSPDDPERMSRRARRKIFGDATDKWRTDLRDVMRWRRILLAALAAPDVGARTFNAIVVVACAYEYTADVAAGKAPEHALWWLVENSFVEHTLEAPILFRITDQGRRFNAEIAREEAGQDQPGASSGDPQVEAENESGGREEC